MKISRLSFFFFALFLCAFFSYCTTTKKSKDRFVLIETNLGNMKIRLYNETPLHKDNFIFLVKQRFYDGIVFHRVIEEFMIQAGDPATNINDNIASQEYFNPDSTIPAEFQPHLYHKKGALAAARMGDNVNPEQESSPSQFYIVHGKVLSDEELDTIEQRINNMRKQTIFFRNINKEKEKAFQHNEPLDYAKIQQTATIITEEEFKLYEPYKIPEDHRQVYKTVGGVPHLDGSYTVFGEVVEGLDIIDKIAAVPTDSNDHPHEEIVITMKLVRR